MALWLDLHCRDLSELRRVLTLAELDRHVVRLHLDMVVSLSEDTEVERVVRDLDCTDATDGRAGVLLVELTNLRLEIGSGDAFPEDLPPLLRDTVTRLDQLVASAPSEVEKSKATRALSHLFKLLQSQHVSKGRAL